MALEKCGLNLNGTKRELSFHGTLEFQCGGYSWDITDVNKNVIPWHWHEDFELIFVQSGTLILNIPARTLSLKENSVVLINANVLHSAQSNGTCSFRSLVFSPLFIAGSKHSVFAKKYIDPLVACHQFSCLQFKNESASVTHLFVDAFAALRDEPDGFEFTVRDCLSQIMLAAYLVFNKSIEVKGIEKDADVCRIKTMLGYIHSHYAENISLIGIAGSASIGQRECLRCFKRMLQVSPLQYLIKYRIMHGADLLLKNRNLGIAEIATMCGFDSPSNFSKLFKQINGLTPRQFRKSN